MTRKCALCKGTNYKRTHSFFSAPKDPDIRRKWQAAIPIANYTVTDDTYVCSKHFKSSDIITHWVSGVPPYVITIKYKKCRLRTGAVPCLNLEENDDASDMVVVDGTDRNDELLGNETSFLIPREKSAESIAVDSRLTESNIGNLNESTESPIKLEEYVAVDQNNQRSSQTEFVDDNISHKIFVLNEAQIQESTNQIGRKEFNQSINNSNHVYPQIHKVEGNASVINEALQKNWNNKPDGKLQNVQINSDVCPNKTLPSDNVKLEQNVEVIDEELMIPEDDPLTLHTNYLTDNDEEDHDDTIENAHRISKKQKHGDNIFKELQYKAKNECSEENPDLGLCDTMLFEDLLEIYTEVTLPRGWAFLVTSKGHSTTVVYLYMNVPTNHIPVVEKQVYIKSDMVMHCGIGSREINPFHHNLMKDGKKNRVHALSDIEELIDELDQRYICEGGPNIQKFVDIEPQLAYVDGMKWRHVRCPIIVNNGSSRCSKCAGLNSLSRSRNRSTKRLSFDMLGKKQRKIESLRRSLKKITIRNQKLEGIRLRFKHRLRLLLTDSEKTIENRLGSSNMPEIHKLMIKECLKASMFKKKNNVRYSETWIFLCLLLYVESPRMYKYMFLNNYMSLPSMGIIRKYFNQIKTDPQFYNLFQRSVEPYQLVVKQGEEAMS